MFFSSPWHIVSEKFKEYSFNNHSVEAITLFLYMVVPPPPHHLCHFSVFGVNHLILCNEKTRKLDNSVGPFPQLVTKQRKSTLDFHRYPTYLLYMCRFMGICENMIHDLTALGTGKRKLIRDSDCSGFTFSISFPWCRTRVS